MVVEGSFSTSPPDGLLSLSQTSFLREGMRKSYAEVLTRCPSLHAEVTSRAIVGNVAFGREVVTGLREHTVDAMAIYEVDEEGLIRRVWFVIDERDA